MQGRQSFRTIFNIMLVEVRETKKSSELHPTSRARKITDGIKLVSQKLDSLFGNFEAEVIEVFETEIRFGNKITCFSNVAMNSMTARKCSSKLPWTRTMSSIQERKARLAAQDA